MNAREVQAKLLQFDAFEGDVDDVLSAFLLLQFQMTEPDHAAARADLMDTPVERLLRTLWERRMIRHDIDLPDLVLAFQIVNAGLTAFWAANSASFAQVTKVLQVQMKLFSEGLKAGEAWEV